MASTSSAPSARPVSPLRVGVVGLGYAGTTHLEAFAAIPGVEVVALAGKETERLAALGAAHGIPHLSTEWEDLVALDDLDVVSIGAPNALHHPIGMAALRSGKHVFCEKPLALTADRGARARRRRARARPRARGRLQPPPPRRRGVGTALHRDRGDRPDLPRTRVVEASVRHPRTDVVVHVAGARRRRRPHRPRPPCASIRCCT